MAAIEVKVPDIGDFKDVPVIEVLVKPSDAVKKDDSLNHARERQGDDGSARAVGRHREGAAGKGRRQGERGQCDHRPRGRCRRRSRTEGPRHGRARFRPRRREARRSRTAAGVLPREAAGRHGQARTSRPGRCKPPRPRQAAAAPRGSRRHRAAAPAPRPRTPEAAPDGMHEGCRRTRAPACAASRASWASTWQASRAPVPRAASSRKTSRISCSGTARPRPGNGRGRPTTAGARRRPRGAGTAPGVAEGGLREVRPGGAPGALAHPEDLGPRARAQLGDDSARHAVRRGGRH